MPGNISKTDPPIVEPPVVVGDECLGCGLGIEDDGGTRKAAVLHNGAPPAGGTVLLPYCDPATNQIVYVLP